MAKKIIDYGSMEETYTLPSLGKLYGDKFPPEVSIRSMTTFEEKMRLGNQGFFKTMCNILNATVTSPADFDAEQLTTFDFNFLLYKMRTVSYGPTYKVNLKCPHCGKDIVCKVNLDDLEVTYINEDATSEFEIGPLPRTGDILTCKHVTIHDLMENEKRAKEILKNHPDYVGDPDYILNMVSKIKAINGEAQPQAMVQMYIEKLNSLDASYFQQAYDNIVGNIGMSTRCESTCPDCGEDLEFILPFNSEFFRPTFDF